MSYSPNNVCVFLKALAGALAGLRASGRNLTDADAAVYYAGMATAYAEAFDTAWNSGTATGAEEDMVLALSIGVWSGISPLESTKSESAAAYEGIVTPLVALARAGNAKVVAEGVDPNGCVTSPAPPDLPTVWGPWTKVDAGSIFAPSNTQRALLIDAGVPPTDQVQIEFPPAPAEGQVLLLNDYENRSSVNPILLIPPGGGVGIAVIDAPGTFDTTGPVVMSLPGGTTMGLSVGFQYFGEDKRWIQWL